MIGDAMWYRLTNDNLLQQTCNDLKGVIGNSALLSGDGGGSPAKFQSAAAAPVVAGSGAAAAAAIKETTMSPAECREKAWVLLHTADKIHDVQGMNDAISYLGLSEAAEMEMCSKEELKRLAAHLKPIPKRNFEKLMNCAD